MKVKISSLKPGDRFSFIPAAWFGPSVVIESRLSGHSWKLKFSNSKIINPPGIWYGSPDKLVRKLKKTKGQQ